MKMKWAVLGVCVISLQAVLMAQNVINVNDNPDEGIDSSGLIQYVVDFITDHGRTGSFVFKAKCNAGGYMVNSGVLDGGKKLSLDALKKARINGQSIDITDNDGHIRAVAGNVDSGILNVKIDEFRAGKDGAVFLDLGQVMNDVYVLSFMNRHNLRAKAVVENRFTAVHWRKSLILKNKSVRQLLDIMADAVGGAWVYGVCRVDGGSQYIYINIYEGQGGGTSRKKVE